MSDQIGPQYPNLRRLGIEIIQSRGAVLAEDVYSALDRAYGKDSGAREKFDEWFGVQTCPHLKEGAALYAWDVEAVLERMASGKLIGTQLFWD